MATKKSKQPDKLKGAEPKDLVQSPHPEGAGFKERITPIPLESGVFVWRCACGNLHLRHAGYLRLMLPFLESGGEKRMVVENAQVMVCVACRQCTAWNGKQLYDVTDQVDLKAWEKAEVELHKATGPGGQC